MRPTGRRIFEVLLTTERGRIQQSISIGQALATSCVSRVGVENVLVNSKEDTESMRLPFCEPRLTIFPRLELVLFPEKEGLVSAVLDSIEQLVRSGTVASNYTIKSWNDFESWFGRYIEFQDAVSCRLSCPFGTIGSDLSSEQAQLLRSVKTFFEWCTGQLARFFAERKAAGELSAETDPDALADLCMTVMEGGMLLSKITRNTGAFRNAAEQTVQYVRMLRVECPTRERSTQVKVQRRPKLR